MTVFLQFIQKLLFSKKPESHNSFAIISWIVLILILLPFLFFASYAQPWGDDFQYSSGAINKGIFETLREYYTLGNGRYFSTLVNIINPLLLRSIDLMRLELALVIFLSFHSILFFISTITEKALAFHHRMFAATLLFFIFYYKMPILSEGSYWLASVATHNLGSIFVLYFLSFAIRYKRQPILKKNYINILFLIICGAGATGCNEISMASSIMIMFSFAFIELFFLKKRSYKTLFILLIVIVGTTIVVIAPGNYSRMNLNVSFFEGRQIADFQFSLTSSLVTAWDFILQWTNILFLLTAVIATPLIIYVLKNSKRSIFKLNPIISLVWSFLFVAACLFPLFWAFGEAGPRRALNVTYFTIIMLFFFNLVVLLNYFKHKLPEFHFKTVFIAIILLPVLLHTLNSNNNLKAVYNCIQTGEAKEFKKERQAYYDKIAAHTSKVATCYLTPLVTKPSLLYLTDLSANPECWWNVVFARYFNINEVSLSTAPPDTMAFLFDFEEEEATPKYNYSRKKGKSFRGMYASYIPKKFYNGITFKKMFGNITQERINKINFHCYYLTKDTACFKLCFSVKNNDNKELFADNYIYTKTTDSAETWRESYISYNFDSTPYSTEDFILITIENQHDREIYFDDIYFDFSDSAFQYLPIQNVE